MLSKRLRFALIFIALLFSSISSIQADQPIKTDQATQTKTSDQATDQTTLQESPASYGDATTGQTTQGDQPLYFDATNIERFGSISVLASQKVYTVSKGHHNEQERDKDGNHILNAIELEMQIIWKARKVVENQEDINVYTLNNAGEFIVTKTIKYGTTVELTPYEYLEEDVLRYKGMPDPNFKLSDYTQYARAKKAPTFRLRVQAEFRTFIENNKELVSSIEALAEKYGYRNCEVSYFITLPQNKKNQTTFLRT